MKRAIVLVSALFLLPFGAKASENIQSICAKDSQSQACQAYISGVVDGYIASKQKYLETQPEFESAYASRVYAHRVGSQRVTQVKAKPACLPKHINTDEIITQLGKSMPEQDLTTVLGDYLRQQYPCQ